MPVRAAHRKPAPSLTVSQKLPESASQEQAEPASVFKPQPSALGPFPTQSASSPPTHPYTLNPPIHPAAAATNQPIPSTLDDCDVVVRRVDRTERDVGCSCWVAARACPCAAAHQRSRPFRRFLSSSAAGGRQTSRQPTEGRTNESTNQARKQRANGRVTCSCKTAACLLPADALQAASKVAAVQERRGPGPTAGRRRCWQQPSMCLPVCV